MNLVDGIVVSSQERDVVMGALGERILKTLAKPRIRSEQVIRACEQLVSTFDESLYREAVLDFGIPEALVKAYADEARVMFSGEALRQRLDKELGQQFEEPSFSRTVPGDHRVTEQLLPLGVLLHLAAGNADGIPAFSVLEGLLTGNINILKLPSIDGGMSVEILARLVEIEPALAEYVYVFNYSSKDLIQIRQLIEAADGVVVWGGIEAVSTLRGLIPPQVKIIEWGHKLSFAYVTKGGIDRGSLEGIAANIAQTGQLLCSSCQGIFVDTEDEKDLVDFCEVFLPILEQAVVEYTDTANLGSVAQTALQRRTDELASVLTGTRVFAGANCSLTISRDHALEQSSGYGNVWVKSLPRSSLLPVLRPYKNYLQTVGLSCGKTEKESLIDILLRTGVVRVTSGRRMSTTYSGAAHDGEFALRRYMKVTAVE